MKRSTRFKYYKLQELSTRIRFFSRNIELAAVRVITPIILNVITFTLIVGFSAFYGCCFTDREGRTSQICLK